MAEIVNLRTARKRAKRLRRDEGAAANRIAHGLPISERKRNAAHRAKVRRGLEQHRIETREDR